MKITDVIFQVHPRNQARNRGNFAFYGQLSRIAVYRVATDCVLVGNGLSTALFLHLGAVLPTATGHVITQMEQYEEDVLCEPIRSGVAG